MSSAPIPNPWLLWVGGAIVFLLVVVGGALVFSYALRRYFGREERARRDELGGFRPVGDNPAAFSAAAMHAVIQKLREQEKELEALHQREKERARQTERLSEAVTRNMPAGLLLVNAAGLIISANPAAEAALGVRGLAYRRYTEALGHHPALTAMLTSCLQEALTYRREEIEYTTPAGEVRQLGLTISPILHGPKKVSGALCLLSDLTELTLLQKQMRLRENLATLGELSAGIAHEFKNSLATISGYAQMIRSEAAGQEIAEHAGQILEETRALTHVVTEFLKFARPLELASEAVAIGPLIERVVEEVREAMPRTELSTAGEFAEVEGDEGLLRQALLNLARNAAEAVSGQPNGGRVVVRGSLEPSGASGMQRISIADDGPGIPAEALAKIFLPFYTTKTNGTGLGLAVVQKIVVQHGGAIEARNQPEGGAEFILWLPLRRQAAETVDSATGGI